MRQQPERRAESTNGSLTQRKNLALGRGLNLALIIKIQRKGTSYLIQ